MRDYFTTLDARNKTQAKYDRDHTKRISIKLNLRTDADIIHWLWYQDSMQGSIKRLIREEIARQNESDK